MSLPRHIRPILPRRPHRGHSRALCPNKPGGRTKDYQKQAAKRQRQRNRIRFHARLRDPNQRDGR